MIHARNLHDCHLLSHDPDLQREVTSYLLYCYAELLEYEDKETIDDFNFMVLNKEDLLMLDNLSTPEETVQVNIRADGHIMTIYRINPTEVFFIPAKISVQFTF